jgi:hypothetical protein
MAQDEAGVQCEGAAAIKGRTYAADGVKAAAATSPLIALLVVKATALPDP